MTVFACIARGCLPIVIPGPAGQFATFLVAAVGSGISPLSEEGEIAIAATKNQAMTAAVERDRSKMPRGGGKSAEDDATDAGGATEAAASLAMIDLLREQQRAMLEQQQEQQHTMLEQQKAQQELMRSFIDQQKVEMTAHHEEMAALLHKTTEVEERAKVRVPKPTLQKLSTDDDIEDFLSTFE